MLFLDRKIKIFLSRRDTPPCLRHTKKSIDHILGGSIKRLHRFIEN